MNAYDRKHRQGSYTPFYSFLFSLTIILFVYILRRITPFGGESLLRNDLYHQYAPFPGNLFFAMTCIISTLLFWRNTETAFFTGKACFTAGKQLLAKIFLFRQPTTLPPR